MRINFYLRDKAPYKNCAIRAHLKINGTVQRIPTNFHSTPENWNTKRQIPRESHPEHDLVLGALGFFDKEIRNYFRSTRPPYSKQGLLEFLNEGPKPLLLHELAEEHYIKPRKKKGTLTYYQDFINHLKTNTPNITIHDIDLKFWENYSEKLFKMSHSVRTQYQKHVKAVLNSALKSELTTNSSFIHFRISQANEKKESKPRLSFTKEEITELAKINFRTPSRNEMRDKICLFCFLGLRVSDWEIRKEDIDFQKNVVYCLNRKSTARVTLPIFSQAYDILRKYNFTIPSATYQQKYNAFRQVMAEAKDTIPSLRTKYKIADTEGQVVTREKWQLISLHATRRTYCTWLYKAKHELDITEREIMQLSGHTSLTEFLKYINLSNEEVAQKVNQKIAEMAADGIQF